MALAETPLRWTIELRTPVPFPDEKGGLNVQLWHESASGPIAETTHWFVVGQSEQSFAGQARPPAGGWQSGNYQLRSSLVAGQRTIAREPVDFKLGVLAWTETQLELTPEAVQEAGYVVDAGVNVERLDALVVQARGTVEPCRPLFIATCWPIPELPSRCRPSPPACRGLPMPCECIAIGWSISRRISQRCCVRVGFEGSWVSYQDEPAPQSAPAAGPVQVSINSVVPADFSPASAPKRLSATDRSYWAAGSGAYQVTLLHGKFDFPIPLSAPECAALLTRFNGPSRNEPSK